MSTTTLTSPIIAVFKEGKLVCITEENSDAHQGYIRENQEFIQERISKLREPFDDHALIYFNLGRDVARETSGDLETYVKTFTQAGDFHRSVYAKEGLQGLRDIMAYKCLLDYYRASTCHDIAKAQNANREEYIKIEEQLTDEDVFHHIYCGIQKYRFELVTVR